MENRVVETKTIGLRAIEYKEISRDGVRLGIIEAYIATWDPDTGGVFGIPDQFVRGAFARSLAEHKSRDDRMVRLKDQHKRTVGGFPIHTMVEDHIGLKGIGEINLDTIEGPGIWALIKQGVLVDMSVGFIVLKDSIINGVRVITEAILREGSVVDEPVNRGAGILGFKSTSFADLPVAAADYLWDADAALARVHAGGAEYKSAFVQDRAEEGDEFSLPIADMIEGKLTVVPVALKAAAEAVMGKPGNEAVVEHLERYFAKMDIKSPFPEDQRRFYGAAEVREWKAADVERALLSDASFSKGAAKAMASRLAVVPDSGYDKKAIARIVSGLETLKREMESK